MSTKAELRKALRAQRALLHADEVKRASRSISRRLLQELDWSSVKYAHIYASHAAWNEVDTEWLIAQLQDRYPRLVIETSGVEPDAPLPTRAYDVIIVPVLGFDAQNYRLGLGKGWYDRFLAGQPQAKKIGLAYDWARCAQLPHELHDVPLDEVITG